MFFALSKILGFLFQPLNWAVGLLLAGLLVRKPDRRGRCFSAGTMVLVAFSNPLLVNVAVRWWEPELILLASIEEPFDIGIVLGGYSRIIEGHSDRLHLGSHPNRLINAVELFKAGKIRKILLAGGSAEVIGRKLNDTEAVRNFLEAAGIPADDIITETRSRNTHENASYSAEIIRERFPGARCLLITSAMHVPRASACFRTQEIEVVAFPTDTLVEPLPAVKPWKAVIPSTVALSNWEYLLREWCGLFVYKMRGYV